MGKDRTTKDEFQKGEIVIYKTAKNEVELKVRLERETIWLDAHQVALLFGVNRPAVVKHINNIYKTKGLEEKSTCSILEQVAADGKIRKMNLYNLDIVISVKNYLIKGYAINEKRLLEAREKFKELQTATLTLLEEYDRGKLYEHAIKK